MKVHIGESCLSATASAHAPPDSPEDIAPEMSALEKIQPFFCNEHMLEASVCIRMFCHPPIGTTPEQVVGYFERLKALAYSGYRESFQSGRHAENNFCILDGGGQEILAATFGEAGSYNVQCQGYSATHNLITNPVPSATAQPLDYKVVWSAWVSAAPPGELVARALAAEEMHNCLNNNRTRLNLLCLNLTSLPNLLPPGITELTINHSALSHLPPLQDGILKLNICYNPLLTYLSTLPTGLQYLYVTDTPLTSLPPLPPKVREVDASDNRLTDLPENLAALPNGASVSLKGNPLSKDARQALREMVHSGLRIRFSTDDPYAPD